MNLSEEIRNSKRKPKELVQFLADSIKKDEKLASQLIDILKTGSDVEKGAIADVMKHVSKEKPEILAPYVDEMIGYINLPLNLIQLTSKPTPISKSTIEKAWRILKSDLKNKGYNVGLIEMPKIKAIVCTKDDFFRIGEQLQKISNLETEEYGKSITFDKSARAFVKQLDEEGKKWLILIREDCPISDELIHEMRHIFEFFFLFMKR
ncbi:MAG: hypothetical protein Sv326_0511 [Candidatus Fermentimicrarchaeum limneticum]|uniref:Uncharacterized protein n=1 Tax=Fermentimicrarchaeum limneticum TaxID=2795018 RepID=A0A7D5XLC5_FERL1|nr:MAG: hypothetical protein Sv326_0511 [Candidatus Fermentimicrarchaeum limneticum]